MKKYIVVLLALASVHALLADPVTSQGGTIQLSSPMKEVASSMRVITQDEFDEKVKRVFTIIKFFFAGFPILIFSVFIDTYNFFINLFYEPEMQVFSEHRGKVSKKGIVTFTETV